MEAFACGLVPVIADSPRSATPQFALDERSLFPAGDTDVLAERIDWWLEHPEERREMGRQARERFQTSFTGQVFAKNIENVYQGVLKGDPHGRK